MSILNMACWEVARRKRSFLLAALAVAVAVGTMLSVYGSLEAYDIRSARALAEKEKSLEKRLAVLKDEMRKATLKLSFNLAILPAEQNLREWHEKDYAEATMPEDYVNRLARSRILAVRHFLPTLTLKTKWPEMERTIIMVGCRGEVPNLAKAPRDPLVQPVPDGKIIVGHELRKSLGLEKGQRVKLMGREFTIHKCYARRGSKDDIGVWLPLRDAQELLDKPGEINSILALECLCVGDAGVARVRAEIAEHLPDTQVVELGTRVVARSEARHHVGEEIAAALEREKQTVQTLKSERAQLASLVVPGTVLACGIWIFLMALGNARTRRSEVAVLRAIGYRAGHVLSLLLFRSLAGGVLGAAFGCAAGLAISAYMGGNLEVPLIGAEGMLSWELVIASVAIGSLLGVAAGWLPALIASQQDPANILKEAP
ncbi:MAG: ABC transporter permease [Planctomycetota bacterium]